MRRRFPERTNRPSFLTRRIARLRLSDTQLLSLGVRFGYSLLLSETIEACRLGYDDCRAFQVVCPICKEPVLKAVRDETHYLSHYPAAGAYAADCELRVSRFDVAAVERQNAESRGQKLALFLRVLRTALMKRDFGNQLEKAQTLFRMLERSKPLAFVYGEFEKSMRHFDEKIFDEAADFYVNKDVGPHDPMFRTGFALATQRRIAVDVWRSLMTPPQEPNRRFVFHNAYAMVLWRLQLLLDTGEATEPVRRLRNYAERLLQLNREKGMELLAEMAHTPAPPPLAEPGSSYLVKLMAETTHEMIGSLLRIDYFDILRQRQTRAEGSANTA